MIDIPLYLILAVLGSLLFKRLSSNPVKLFRSRVVETGPNTFTTKEIGLPIQVVGTNTIHGIEMQWIDWYGSNPSAESGQSNLVESMITKDPITALIERDDENFLWGFELNANSAVANGMYAMRHPYQHKCSDPRGRGQLLADTKIHHSIKGIGNSAADRSTALGYGYITELTGGDVIQLLLEEDD